jgi:hypothetical protein
LRNDRVELAENEYDRHLSQDDMLRAAVPLEIAKSNRTALRIQPESDTSQPRLRVGVGDQGRTQTGNYPTRPKHVNLNTGLRFNCFPLQQPSVSRTVKFCPFPL